MNLFRIRKKKPDGKNDGFSQILRYTNVLRELHDPINYDELHNMYRYGNGNVNFIVVLTLVIIYNGCGSDALSVISPCAIDLSLVFWSSVP